MKIKRILAVVMAAVMLFAMATGCSKKASSSAGNVKTSDKLTCTVKMSASTGDGDMEVSLTTKTDGKSTSLSFSGIINIEDVKLNLDCDDVLILSGDVLYLNVKEALSLLDELNEASDGEIGVTSDTVSSMISTDWVSIEIPGLSELQGEKVSYTGYNDEVKEAYAELIKVEGNKTSMVIDNAKDAQKLLDITADFIEDNMDEWADLILESYNSIDIEKFITTMVDSMIESVIDMYKEMGYELSDDEIAQIREEAAKQLLGLDTSELEIDKDDILDMFKDMADELAEAEVSEDDFEDAKISYVTTETDTKVTTEVLVEVKEVVANFSVVVEAPSSLKIPVPSDATDVMDLIASIMQMAQ